MFAPKLKGDGLNNPFSTVHFRPKQKVTKVARHEAIDALFSLVVIYLIQMVYVDALIVLIELLKLY